MPALLDVVGVRKAYGSGDQVACQTAGRSRQCNPTRDGKPAADPGDPLLGQQKERFSWRRETGRTGACFAGERIAAQ